MTSNSPDSGSRPRGALIGWIAIFVAIVALVAILTFSFGFSWGRYVWLISMLGAFVLAWRAYRIRRKN